MTPAAPGPRISIFELRERPERKKPWTVIWSYNGKQHWSPAMAYKREADRWRARLVLAVEEGTKWNSVTGLPVKWNATDVLDVSAWCRRWLRQEWEGLVPKSRLSIALALVFLVERSAPESAPESR